jgi:hypothetical protein
MRLTAHYACNMLIEIRRTRGAKRMMSGRVG